jgi:hypothetical protein
MHLETDWGAWQLNEITLMVGRRVQKNVDDGRDAFYGFSGQRSAVSNRLASYRSIKGKVTKKVKVKSDGTW